MNNLELLKEMISEYNAERVLAAKAKTAGENIEEIRYNHGAYKLAPFIDRIANELGLEIERFDKEFEFMNYDYDMVKRTVSQIRIEG